MGGDGSGGYPSTSKLEDTSGTGALIEIRTKTGFVQCAAEEIVPKRFGLHIKACSILLEYEVPRHGLLAHHPIAVDFTGAEGIGTSCGSSATAGYPAGGRPDDTTLAVDLRTMHSPWLDNVQVEQVAALVGRLRAAVPRRGGAAEGGAAPPRQLVRARVQKVPETARASKRSKEPEIRKVFDAIRGESTADTLTLEDLRAFVGDYLGFGQAEVEAFFARHADGTGAEARLTFEGFSKGYALLNPFMLGPGRKEEVFVRRPGSLGGLQQAYPVQQADLAELEDSEVYVCTQTAQAFVDGCKRCVVLIGPCESSVFVRECEDCVFYLAAQQLRTRDCKRCTFFLYSKSEPAIETSEDLAFAPWSARYPGCAAQFEKARFDPQRNFWNAVFDFSGKMNKANWRILPLEEVRELCVDLPGEPPEGMSGDGPDNPCPKVTHAMLSAPPLASEDCGQGVANIPQTRPDPPPEPRGPVRIPELVVRDVPEQPKRQLGARYLEILAVP